jgi:pyruvate,water dikinase
VPALDLDRFVATRPGEWSADGVHSPRPSTSIGSRTYGAPIERGSRLSFARYGALGDSIAVEPIERFQYTSRRDLILRPPGDDRASRAAFEAMLIADPTLQERLHTAEQTLKTRRWEGDLKHWDEVTKPWLLGRTFALTDVDPTQLDDDGLDQYLRATVDQLEIATRHHHILNLVATLPTQRFNSRTIEWTGERLENVVLLMQGASPISIGDEPELRALAKAVANDGAAEALVDAGNGGDAADRVEQLRTHDGAVGDAMGAYIRLAGYRSIGGWEAMEPYALEEPVGILATIRSAIEGPRPGVDPGLVAAVRDQVPAEHLDEWDALFAEARRFARVRDERDVYCNIPAAGLVRRSAIEIGRRLRTAHRVEDVEHATEGSVEELAALLRGEDAVSPATLADRHQYRLTYTIKDIPQTVGEPLPPPVPWEWLPEPWQLLTMLTQQGTPGVRSEAPELVSGMTAQRGSYEGAARVITGPHEFSKIQQGDVLVTPSTNPAFSVILPLLGAIVTDYGNPLSHAAIIAREFGLPAIVGCIDATERLRDGDLVRVDADAGTVEVLSAAADGAAAGS